MKLSLIAVVLAVFGTTQVNALRVERQQHQNLCFYVPSAC